MWRSLAIAALALFACGGDEGKSGDPTTAGSGSTTDDDPSTGATASAPMTDDDGSTTADTSDDTTGAMSVACSSTADCGGDEYCEFADDSCGVSGKSGECRPRPPDCRAEERPVCACNGELYASACHVNAAGEDLAFLGGCEVPNGAFRCGYSFCVLGDEYCLVQGGAMPTFSCVALPPVCQPPDCSCNTTCCGCNSATCCSQYCENVDDALTYTCPG